jgi:3'-5' exoribonuclease
MTLRAWADTAAFETCSATAKGDFVALEALFSHSSAFGLDARGWELEPLSEEGIALLLEGSPERQALLGKAWQQITQAVESISDPRLEHTSRMMDCALALTGVYPELNRDLLIAGVLFHDTGKLWETCPPEHGFGIETELRGELLGHLSIGIELLNALWRELPKEGWETLCPPSEEVRLHLLHLVAAHHGQLEFGSPVLPKTPEATILHFIDNIDARLEMFSAAYQTAAGETNSKTPLDWVRPLGVAPITSLPAYRGASAQNPTDFLL